MRFKRGNLITLVSLLSIVRFLIHAQPTQNKNEIFTGPVEGDHNKKHSWQEILAATVPGSLLADDPMLELLNKNTSQVLRLRGYLAQDHYVVTEDGYILNVVRATNPLIEQGRAGLPDRAVVLFVHGALSNANCFLVHSSGAKPRDFGKYRADQLDLKELNKLLEGGGSAHSLVFTMLDFGHEIWLLNRRGNSYSQGHIDWRRQAHTELEKTNGTVATLFQRAQEAFQSVTKKVIEMNQDEPVFTTLPPRSPFSPINFLKAKLVGGLPNPFSLLEQTNLVPNPKYWDFSMDEQARYDIPAVVDYVLKKSGRQRLAYVGHSVGGALGLQALSLNSSLNTKFSKALIWAPALDLDANKLRSLILSLAFIFLTPLRHYEGEMPPKILIPFMQDFVGDFCSSKLTRASLCNPIYEILYGPGADQNYLVAGASAAFPDSMSSHELAQLAQFTTINRGRKFDFGTREKNILRYKQETPPLYNLSAITTDKLKIYYSETDYVIPANAVRRMMSGIRVTHKWFLFKENETKFNHQSYMLHRNITQLLVVPSLRDIQSGGI